MTIIGAARPGHRHRAGASGHVLIVTHGSRAFSMQGEVGRVRCRTMTMCADPTRPAYASAVSSATPNAGSMNPAPLNPTALNPTVSGSTV
jgi:hypothetical protein